MTSSLEQENRPAQAARIDDQRLLSAYCGGDDTAFELLVKEYFQLIYAVALRRVSDPHLAEEVAQSTFIILSRKARTIPPSVPLRGWLLRTAVFVSNDALKATRRRAESEQRLDKDLHQPVAADPGAEQANLLLEEAILALSPLEQSAVFARFFDGRSYKEIGEMLGLGEDTAQKRVSRSLEKMRRYLLRHGANVAAAGLGGLLAEQLTQPVAAEVVQAALRVAQAAAQGQLAGTFSLNLAARCGRLLTLKAVAASALRAVLALGILAGCALAVWLGFHPAMLMGIAGRSNASKIEELGKEWSQVVLRAARAKQTFTAIPTPDQPGYAAYEADLRFVLSETTRISAEVFALLKQGPERDLLARFLTVELRETLHLDRAKQAAVFALVKEHLSRGATLDEAMKAMAQASRAEATEIKALLQPGQRVEFDAIYGADGLCLFQFLKTAIATQ